MKPMMDAAWNGRTNNNTSGVVTAPRISCKNSTTLNWYSPKNSSRTSYVLNRPRQRFGM